jgi:hypothetical protein
MATCHLRVFPHNEETVVTPKTDQEATVPVRLHELLSVLRQATKANYVWLRDFQDDEVRVTPDFFDVIRAFSSLRPSA